MMVNAPAAPLTVAQAFVDSVKRFAANVAMVTASGESITYEELGHRVATAVSILRRLGCEPGDRIAIWMQNCPQWGILEYAAALLGLMVVPVNARYRASEAEHVLLLSNARIVFTQPAFMTNRYLDRLSEIAGGDLGSGDRAQIGRLPKLSSIVLIEGETVPGTVSYADLARSVEPAADLEALAASRRPEDRLWVFWTSGSTSAPKGAILTQAAITNVWNWTTLARYRADDRVLVARPLFYIAGNFWALLGPMLHGATSVIGQEFTPREIMELCTRERITILSGNPLLLKGVVNDPACDPRAFKHVRMGYFGGSSVSLQDLQQIKEKIGFEYLMQPYGMTELEGFAMSTHPDDPLEIVYATCGRPLPGFELKLIDPETGLAVPVGQVGELMTRGRGLVGYEGISEQDRGRLFDAEGWFRSGDLLKLREDGRYEFIGRAKDLIKVGGENVTAAEIETKLMEHPDVANVAVVAIADEKRGEVPLAFIELRSARPLESLAMREWCQTRMAPFKVPAGFKQVLQGDWPLTASGKIIKNQLPVL